jgi:hypothetical protein
VIEMPAQKTVVQELLRREGRTFAQDAGIKLADRPSPLYQLLVLATLLSARIGSDIAVAAARELFDAGYRTPQAMLEATWQDRVDALGRGHYKRYDERTATMLGDGAQLLQERWRGDLRKLHEEAGGNMTALRSLLGEFPGIGPTGTDIFLREVQGVWPDVAPFVDKRAVDGAGRLGLPDDPDGLARLADRDELPRMVSALVRVSRSKHAADEILGAGG